MPRPYHIRARLSFDEAHDVFNNRWTNEIYYKTFVEKIDDDTYSVRYRDKDIILIHRDGNYTLFAGDRSDKVMARFIAYSPAVICKIGNRWRLLNGARFRDGMRINRFGEPVDEG